MGRNTEDKNTLVPIHFLNALVILPSLASGGDARTKVIGSKNIYKKKAFRCQRETSVVRSTCFSCREPGFSS